MTSSLCSSFQRLHGQKLLRYVKIMFNPSDKIKELNSTFRVVTDI